MTPRTFVRIRTQLLATISLMTATHLSFANWLDIDDLFTSMEEQMQQVREKMQNMQNSMKTLATQQCKGLTSKALATQIVEDSSKTGIVITISNLQTDSIDAQLDDQSGVLRITTPNTTIKIATRNTVLTLDINETIKYEQKEKDEKSEEAFCQYFSAQNQSYVKESLKKPIDLFSSKTKIDYNTETQQLVIATPYLDEAKTPGKKLPVTILKASEKKEVTTPIK